ncbi:MAG: methylmalonyl Co-A mutase-associated GTPase MeaB [Dongiaceae bacterium]
MADCPPLERGPPERRPAERAPLERARLARTISALENAEPVDAELLRRGQARLAEVRVVGLTGPPGAGKSTLADAIAAAWAGQGRRVAVIAVDPSSPWSGGALLGDRFRMGRCEPLDEVYVRSVAARGHPGGLAAAVPEICVALAAFGVERILVETVGAGQNDVEVKDHADAVVVVSVPGLGDFLQVAKAGLMEIGDVYAVNKADMPGAEAVRADIEGMLDIAYAPLRRGRPAAGPAPSAGERMLRDRHGPGEGAESWRPPVLPVAATTGAGVDDLIAAVDRHLAWSETSGHFGRRRLAMLRAQLAERLAVALRVELGRAEGDGPDRLSRWAGRVAAAELLPQEAVAAMLREFRAHPGG